MNEKTLYLIVMGVLVLATGWLCASAAFTDPIWLAVTFTILGVGIICRLVAWQVARTVVIQRRRLLKALWRRGEAGDRNMERYEEEIVVLLGRIKMVLPYTAFTILLVTSTVFFRSRAAAPDNPTNRIMWRAVALAFSIGLIFLAVRLCRIAQSIARALSPDAERPAPSQASGYLPTQRVRVEIDRHKVHDFILPSAALPFWTLQKAERWLRKCGFERTGPRTWEADGAALCYLDDDEILAIDRVK